LGLPAPVPADPIRLALSGDLRVALDRDLAMAALQRLEAERGPPGGRAPRRGRRPDPAAGPAVSVPDNRALVWQQALAGHGGVRGRQGGRAL
jgi:hypothetical protein